MNLAERVLRTIRKRGLAAPGARIAVALSGGADSVALVHLLRELEHRGAFRLAGAAHFNHQLRGAEADDDEAFCRDLATRLGISFEAGRADVRTLARAQRRSVEDAARSLRYAFLGTAAERLGADTIAVAHTVEDQAETFLLRLIRGAGPRGLAGIRPRVGTVVRPLIDVRRAEVRGYLEEHRIPFREDSTNSDVTIPRNRVRHELIPYLEREFSPGIVEVLAREASIAADDDDYLTREALAAAGAVVSRAGSRAPAGGAGSAPDPIAGDGEGDDVPTAVTTVDIAALTSLHPAMASRVARIALARQASNRSVHFDDAARLLTLVRDGKPGQTLSLPGQRARVRDRLVELGPEVRRVKSDAAANSFRVPLSIPGEARLDEQGWCVTAEPLDEPGWRARAWTSAGDAVAVAVAGLTLPLAVRTRRPGDRFRPLGLRDGRKKLQDFFVDRKVARDHRDSVPLVVDAADRIVWVVGLAISEDFRVTEPLSGVLLLKARRLGGLG